MIDQLVIGAFRLFWFCFGGFILFSLAFSILAGRRADLWTALRLPLSIIAGSVRSVCEGCGAVAEHLASMLPKPYAGPAALILHAVMVLGLFFAVLWLAAHASV